MRFVKQTVLYFKEGTSDKTYEIDLCETGPGQYIVNFRYGKRGAALKEGSKTATPVTLVEATAIFDALEKEKRSKGYTGEGDGVATVAYTPISVDDVADPAQKAILKRLDDAMTGKQSFKTKWSTSRVIWAAGELKIRAAAPVILRLIEKGNAMQRYAGIWALGRCGDPAAVSLVSSYIDNSTYPQFLRQMAANAVLQLSTGEERKAFITRSLHALPPEFQAAINAQDMQALTQLLDQRVMKLTEPTYQLLEDLYIVAADNIPVRQLLHALFAALPLRPSYFRHIRHLYKQAEMRDDHALTALFSVRFEREPHMFSTSGKPPAELKKPLSKLAYSNRTRRHLRAITLRRLQAYGLRTDIEYVKLATALLLQYDGALPVYKEAPYRRTVYGYDATTRRYTTREIRYPANSAAVYLNYILRGNQPDLQLKGQGSRWEFIDLDTAKAPAQPKQDETPKKEGFLNQLGNLFKAPKKEEIEQPKASAEKVVKEEPQSNIPFLALWHQLPQAFIQLLISGRMEEIHAFAYAELQASPQFEAIKEKIDANVISGLLINPYSIPQQFGLALAKEKYNPASPSLPLFVALMNSPLKAARELGIEWIKQSIEFCFQDTEFVAALIFAAYDEVRQVAIDRLSKTPLPLDKSRVVIGRAVSVLLAQRTPNDAVYKLLTAGCRVLEQYMVAALEEVDFRIVEDLLKSGIPPAEAFGVRLLLLKKQPLQQISDEIIAGILENAYQPVREGGIAILESLTNEELLSRPSLLLQTCIASYADVRQGIRPILARLQKEYKDLAVWLVNELVPLLMRKETSEGIHNDIADILSNELVDHLHDIDKETALRLTYSNYPATQAFGVLVLEKYIPPAELTLKQVIATGNHELLVVREWCWRFFEQQLPRIRYERDDAIGLLDAKWDDTRTFAMQFFRTHFRDEDWSPETLVAIADSVNPIVQAFGRELLTRFFKAEDGLNYLLKLSQHPGVAMQTFATNYLAQYAAGQLDRLQELEFYFRSVLSRVNKARVAKERIFAFLEQESLKSAEAAQYIAGIIAHISATVAIGDKARCIRIMRRIHLQYPDITLPVSFIAIPEHSS